MKYGSISIDLECVDKLKKVVAFRKTKVRQYVERWIDLEHAKLMEELRDGQAEVIGVDEGIQQTDSEI